MEDLKAQHEERKRAAEDALKVLYREQEDVEELERLSFASFLARIRGEQAERLDQERREAVAAKARYDAARRDLEDLEARFQAAQKERAGLEGLRGRWKALMEEKEELLCQAGGERAKRLIQIGCDLDSLGAQIRELDEAICAGKDVGYALDQMIGQLDSAAGWGTWGHPGGRHAGHHGQAQRYGRCPAAGGPGPVGAEPVPYGDGRRAGGGGARRGDRGLCRHGRLSL